MAYGWIITRDHLADATSDDTGRMGPRDLRDEIEARLLKGEGRAFRMRDDDGELYFSGRIIDTTADADGGEWDFAPLDDYGMPGAGCTSIEYREGNRWVAL